MLSRNFYDLRTVHALIRTRDLLVHARTRYDFFRTVMKMVFLQEIKTSDEAISTNIQLKITNEGISKTSGNAEIRKNYRGKNLMNRGFFIITERLEEVNLQSTRKGTKSTALGAARVD